MTLPVPSLPMAHDQWLLVRRPRKATTSIKGRGHATKTREHTRSDRWHCDEGESCHLPPEQCRITARQGRWFAEGCEVNSLACAANGQRTGHACAGCRRGTPPGEQDIFRRISRAAPDAGAWRPQWPPSDADPEGHCVLIPTPAAQGLEPAVHRGPCVRAAPCSGERVPFAAQSGALTVRLPCDAAAPDDPGPEARQRDVTSNLGSGLARLQSRRRSSGTETAARGSRGGESRRSPRWEACRFGEVWRLVRFAYSDRYGGGAFYK